MVAQGSSWRIDRPISQLWVLLRAQCTALLACVTYCLSLTQIRGPNTLGVLVIPLHPPGLCIHHLHLPRTKNSDAKNKKTTCLFPPTLHQRPLCLLLGRACTNTLGRKRKQATSTFPRNHNFKRSSCQMDGLRTLLWVSLCPSLSSSFSLSF